MANSYTTLSAAYKMDLGEKLSLGLYLNDGYGADASYTQGFYTGLQARWDSNQTAIIGRYAITDRVSVYGGARVVNSSATIAIPDQMIRASTQAAILEQTGQTTVAAADTALANFITLRGDPTGELAQTRALLGATVAAPVGSFQYDADGAGTTDYGYVAGVAYEIPDIALRVALTYESAIEHEFDTTESLPVFGIPGSSQTKVTMPQSVTLDFQTGVAAGTLVFGKIKWTEWSEWEVRTPGYESVTGGNVTGLDNDTISYNLGIGRQFNDRLSGFAQMSYEKANGGIASRLAPTDGSFGLGIGGQYTLDDMKLRAGVQYVKLGDATDGSGVEFSGNSALGFGFQVSFSF